MRRREFLKVAGSGALGLSAAACCPTPKPPVPKSSAVDSVAVDVHCHVFNAADLPVASFLIGTQLRDFYDEHPLLRSAADFLGREVADLLTSCAPDAATERRFLSGALPAAEDPLRRWDDGVGRLRGLLAASDVSDVAALRGAALPPALEAQRLWLRRRIVDEIGEPPPGAGAGDTLWLSVDSVGRAVEELARLLAWCRQLCDLRIRNIDVLLKLFGPQRLGVGIIAPSLVDFARWLPDLSGGSVGAQPRVSIDDQVKLMEDILRLRPGVHPFVAVDPLREWPETKALLDGCFSRDGKGELGNGFVGVKLYPPMGFAPLENPHLAVVDAGLPARVEHNLAQLYAYCQEHVVPVMAHCNASNDTKLGHDNATAAAAGWTKVVERYPRLRLNLAHFGGVGRFVAGMTEEQTTIGGFLDASEGVYTDFADETGVFDPDFRARFVAALGRYVQAKPERAKRIMYGSDWSMLGKEKGYHGYFSDWHATFQDALAAGDGGTGSFTRESVEGFFGRNALAFLGLSSDTKSRRRLLAFYRSTFGLGQEDVSWLQDEVKA